MAMAPSDISPLRAELQKLRSLYSKDMNKDEAFKLAMEAAELHLKFLRVATDQTEKKELRQKCDQLLTEAEKIKTSKSWDAKQSLLMDIDFPETKPANAPSPSYSSKRGEDSRCLLDNPGVSRAQSHLLPEPVQSRQLTNAENVLLLRGSQLYGFKFPPWQGPPKAEEFDLSSTGELFTDSPDLQMSPAQCDILDGWKRPVEAFPPRATSSQTTNSDPQTTPSPSMEILNRTDFVQDAATDCSVVASLAAGAARAESGHAKLLSSIIFPYDLEKDRPMMSTNGKYIVRLNFNGCARKVVIDDRLPVSRSTRILHVVDRNNPSLVWPALLEKAYLKARGGYAFPGSNSGTDLWILSGWIPEQVFLRHPDTDMSKLWPKVFHAFRHGNVLVTIGTREMTTKAEEESGLAGQHDYAVLDMKEHHGSISFLVKNPWLKGTSWKDPRSQENTDPASPRRKLPSESDESYIGPTIIAANKDSGPSSTETGETRLRPGTFWMEINDILQYFETIYLNWNPGLFTHRQDIHFTWDLSQGRSPVGSFTRNPQFFVTSKNPGPLWIVVSRHFSDGSPQSFSKSKNWQEGLISLYAFAGQENRVYLSRGASHQGPYVDSLQTLLQIDPISSSGYTIVLSEEELPSETHAFTLSAFSKNSVSLREASSRYSHQTRNKSSWTKATSGGNANSTSYSQNPQFTLALPSKSALSLVLETLTPDIRVHVKLIYGQGQRLFSLSSKDVVLDSGEYRRGCAHAESDGLDAGTYTVVCSTFDTGQFGDFTLQVESSVRHTVRPISKEGAGRIRTRLTDASFGAGSRVLAAPVIARRLARANFTARYVALPDEENAKPLEQTVASTVSPTRLSLELGVGPNRYILLTSGGGTFSDSARGIRTEDVDLSPEQARGKEMWLVLERLGGFEGMGRREERVSVEMFADAPGAVEVGVWREWDR